MFTATSATPATTATPPSTDTGPNSQSQLTSENTFLKLLVAQIQNQDPTNPTDPVQFIGQLTQYSELEQLMQINSNIQTLTSNPQSGASPTGASPATPTNTPVAAGSLQPTGASSPTHPITKTLGA